MKRIDDAFGIKKEEEADYQANGSAEICWTVFYLATEDGSLGRSIP